MGSAEAQWTWNNHCGCGTKHYVAEKTLHVEVPMMSNGARVLANTGRTLLGFFTLGISEVAFGGFQDVTHEAITVLFKCKECGSRFYRTYEIVDKEEGKTNELGYYGRVFGTKNVSNKAYSYYTLENVFDRMWSGESYDFLKNNCKHWCRQFRAYLSPY